MLAKLNLYFSNGWHARDVDINLFCWEQVAKHCDLLVDVPDEPKPNPPYYINRLEVMVRRSDLFMAALPYRPQVDRPAQSRKRKTDADLECSIAGLFEIRLAERAGLPRFVLYDIRTGFHAPTNQQHRSVRYIGRNFDELRSRFPNEDPGLKQEIRDWLAWAIEMLRPRYYEYRDTALVLLPEHLDRRDQVLEQIVEALRQANYSNVVPIGDTFNNDAELWSMLGAGGLLVTEMSEGNHLDIYGAAHALFIPSVRMFRRSELTNGDFALPRLLRGHPGGYQHDLVAWSEPTDLFSPIQAHAEAMLAAARTITDYDQGKCHFLSRRYRPHRVFISHNARQGNRDLVDGIILGCRKNAVSCWEYVVDNEVGEEWQPRLQHELEKSTHFLGLLRPDYEQSKACVFELEWALSHLQQPGSILLYKVDGRASPHVKLHHLNQPPLTDDTSKNAERVVNDLVRTLTAKQ